MRKLAILVPPLAGIAVLLSSYFLRKPPGELVPLNEEFIWKGPSELDQVRSAVGRFQVVNRGGRPVRIRSVSSDCGCSKPRIDRDVIQPGQTATVTAVGVPFPIGERSATLTLETDSPRTPTVGLRFVMLGSVPPPFVLTMVGDLSFPEGDPSHSTREITVITVEPPGPGSWPALKSDLPFLDFKPLSLDEKPYTIPGAFERHYKYLASFAGPPPAGTFVGAVSVRDPWISGRSVDLRVHGRSRPAIRAYPEEVVLSFDSGGGPAAGSDLRLLTRDPRPDLQVRPEGGADCPIRVEPTGDHSSGYFHSFVVRWDGNIRPERDQVFALVARESPTSAEQFRIPVRVEVGQEP